MSGKAANPLGLEGDGLEGWLASHVTGLAAPYTAELIAAGQSNLTYLITDRHRRRWVLRRPPLGAAAGSAHDVGREFTIMSALAATEVPVPAVRAASAAAGPLGVPFYVMDFVDGLVVRDEQGAASLLPPEARRNASESLMQVLGAIHGVDVDAVGLGNLGPRRDYVARQLRRFVRQRGEVEPARAGTFARLDNWLAGRIPEQTGVGLVHGDYRLENTVVDGAGTVVAVLDWELCALGDTRADLGMTAVHWAATADEGLGAAAPTRVAGFARADEIVELYRRHTTGPKLGDEELGYFVALAHWKLACIGCGVRARYASGAMGGRTMDVAAIDRSIDRHLAGASASAG